MRHLTILPLFAVIILFSLLPVARPRYQDSSELAKGAHSYLGFDLNEYPGDAALRGPAQNVFLQQLLARATPGRKTNNLERETLPVEGSGFRFCRPLQRQGQQEPEQ